MPTLIKRKNRKLCEKIKGFINHSIDIDELSTKTFSVSLSETLCRKYSHLCKIFLCEYGFNIKTYTNVTKVDRVKKLIDENVDNINEIATKMHYSSSSHLSHQFKMVTNMTPSEYKHTTEIAAAGESGCKPKAASDFQSLIMVVQYISCSLCEYDFLLLSI